MMDENEVKRLLDERTSARKAGDYERADEIRRALSLAGLDIHDERWGTWTSPNAE